MMQSKDQVDRRHFVRLAAISTVSVSFFPSLPSFADSHLPRLEEDNAQATALGYKHATAEVDADSFPNHSAEQQCRNCVLYQGEEGDDWGPCQIFPGMEVSADGWCSAYVAKS